MLFSIVVPVYNVETFLGECLESIIEQVRDLPERCEILLVDDGSTDSSGKICDKYKLQYPDIVHVFHNINQGLLLTRRFGYKHASGEYIINCDSDDVLEKRAIKILRSVILTYNKPDMVIFNHYLYNGTSKILAFGDIFTKEKMELLPKSEVLRIFMTSYSIVSMWGAVCKRNCIDIERDYAKFAHISNGEDTLQKLEILDRAETYVYLNKALYNYRIGSGMTGKFDPNYYESFKVIFEETYHRKKKWNLDNFDELMAIKVLSTSGRAITQSRYKKWKNIREQKDYLKSICEDMIFIQNLVYLNRVQKSIQTDYVILFKLLHKKWYNLVVILLRIRNIFI